jgi:hypothetical protein
MHTSTPFLQENRQGRDNLEALGVDGRIIPNWTLKKLGVTMWTGFIQLSSSGESPVGVLMNMVVRVP